MNIERSKDCTTRELEIVTARPLRVKIETIKGSDTTGKATKGEMARGEVTLKSFAPGENETSEEGGSGKGRGTGQAMKPGLR